MNLMKRVRDFVHFFGHTVNRNDMDATKESDQLMVIRNEWHIVRSQRKNQLFENGASSTDI